MTKILIDNDRYEFDTAAELGRGGFGVVYRGHDRRLNRSVAVKAIHPHLLIDPTFADRFQQEAQTLVLLENHPAIINVYDVVRQDNQLYIVMAYVSGQTLKAYSQTHAPLSLEQTIALLHPLAEALDFAHQQGLLHRDVKPGNVLLTEDLKPLLIDFGLARILEQSTKITLTGSTFGSPEYMAPEQADPNRRDEVGFAADRYALGIMAYELLIGRVPFPGNDNATLYAHEHKEPPPPRQFRSDLPKAAEKVILKMLSKQPADRYFTCVDFIDALKLPTQPIPQRQTRSLPGWAWATGCGTLLLVACLLGLGLREAGDLLSAGFAGTSTGVPAESTTTNPTAVVKRPTSTDTPQSIATDKLSTPSLPPTPSPTNTPPPTMTNTTLPPTNTATSSPPTATATSTPTRSATPTTVIINPTSLTITETNTPIPLTTTLTTAPLDNSSGLSIT
ncbi:MAG: serine/threonine protein kinase, partial [Anaerolineae bacterium]|nr:serine/threonine protein kinase [Anaerolineae bacterium]